jgi:hypothetical protein
LTGVAETNSTHAISSALKSFNILEQEEDGRAKDTDLADSTIEKMSTLMRQSMDDGKFWFHELIHSCFESPENPAWRAIREIIPNINEHSTLSESEIDTFVAEKMAQLPVYNAEWAVMKEEIDRKEAEFEALTERRERRGR